MNDWAPLLTDRLATEINERFTCLHGELFCRNAEHERFYFYGNPGTQLVDWLREHWDCEQS